MFVYPALYILPYPYQNLYLHIKTMSHVLVLPISGGAFPIQLGVLCDLTSHGYKPSLTLAASGGNIAAYTALAGKWCPIGIQRVCKQYGSDIFIKSWWPRGLSFMPSILIGFFKGSTHNSSEKPIDLFNELFTSDTIKESEILTGTIHCSTGRFKLFSNKSKEDSLIGNAPRTHSSRHMECCYLDGDVKQIAMVCIASASIPAIVPGCNINGELHTDGGNICSSPLTVLKFPINNLAYGSSPATVSTSFLERKVKIGTSCDHNISFYYTYYFFW